MEEQQASPGKLQVRLPLLFAITLAIGMFLGQKLPHYDQHVALSLGAGGQGTIDEILRYVDAKYVDTANLEQLSTAAINQMLAQLDPHSVYISPDEAQAVEDDMNGGFEGIGVEFIMIEDTINVVTPLSGGPSEAAGILAGDKIVSISDTIVAGVKIDNGKIYKHLRGQKGSVVKIGILRNKETALRYFNVTRDIIPVKSLDVAYMTDDKTGYFKLNRFTSRTYQEFMEAL
ncbi:MAG: PDZ domain-containing protein, partial [Saprospiraceae bacterium]|nr:PDZ domain-containing protein [Saprospiraceae bacterium]